MSKLDIRLFSKATQPVGEEEVLFLENIFDIDYNRALKDAISKQEWRNGIRLVYLNALRNLSDNGTILYQADKTNSQYLRELEGSGLHLNFLRITRAFEFAWYGNFQVSELQFRIVEKEFNELSSKLQRV